MKVTILSLSALSDSDFISLLREYKGGWEAEVIQYAAFRLFRIQGFYIKPS